MRVHNPFKKHRTIKTSSSILPQQQSHNHESTVTQSQSQSSQSKWSIIVYPILIVTLIILHSIYLDTLIGIKLFMKPSITQTTPNTHLHHILPKKSIIIPPPTAIIPSSSSSKTKTTTVLKPTLGTHRYDQDAIFAIGDGLTIKQFALFIITLRNTGFEGDIVFSTWSRDDLSSGVFEFLEYHSKVPGLIVYEGVIKADNDNEIIDLNDSDMVENTNVWLHGLYGIEKVEGEGEEVEDNSKDFDDDNENEDVDDQIYFDPRSARSIGIARFELYWVWSQQYHTQSRILLIDAKDTYFQPYGEIGIGVGRTCEESSRAVLHLYEENNKMVKLGNIEKQAQLVEAYKDKRIMWFVHNQNVLSPASTHGPQKAIEAYLRAMVQQYDDTGCSIYQCEWAFHNYIYNFGILAKMDGIDAIKTHMQGTGAVNSIGLNTPLNSTNNTEIFDNRTVAVLNRRMGHGKHNSWAVHQYDRDSHLQTAVKELTDFILSDLLNFSQPIQSSAFFFHEYDKIDDHMKSNPTMGTHRPDRDAIFSFIGGDDFDSLALFILSARKSGFDGDIVLNIPDRNDLDEDVVAFLEHHATKGGVILYEGYDIEYLTGKYDFKLEIEGISVEVAKYEYFYIWSHHYRNNQIMILDGEYAYFQSNPFAQVLDCGHLTLNFYEENKLTKNFDFFRYDEKETWDAMTRVFGKSSSDLVKKYKDQFVLNPTAFVGHRHVLQRFLKSLIDLLSTTNCAQYGCDFAAINYMWYEEILEIGNPISVNLRAHAQGTHLINTGIAASSQYLQMRNLLNATSKEYLNWNGEASYVILNYHQNVHLASFFEEKVNALLEEFPYSDKK